MISGALLTKRRRSTCHFANGPRLPCPGGEPAQRAIFDLIEARACERTRGIGAVRSR